MSWRHAVAVLLVAVSPASHAPAAVVAGGAAAVGGAPDRRSGSAQINDEIIELWADSAISGQTRLKEQPAST